MVNLSSNCFSVSVAPAILREILTTPANYVFIHPKIPKRACEFPACQSGTTTKDFSPTIVTMEPIIHWATVAPAETLLCCGRIMTFRRNGEKCDDPLWTQVIKKLVPQYPTAYCEGCLNMLVDHATEIMAMIEKKGATSFKTVNTPRAPMDTARFQKYNDGFDRNGRNAYSVATARESERHDSSERSGDRDLVVSLNIIFSIDMLHHANFSRVVKKYLIHKTCSK
jgi:hypothetical protein